MILVWGLRVVVWVSGVGVGEGKGGSSVKHICEDVVFRVWGLGVVTSGFRLSGYA